MNKYLDSDESDSDFDDDIDIHEIVRTGTFDEVKEAIALDRPRLIALKDDMDRIALHYAADLDRVKVAVFLIAKQANVNAKDKNDQTAMHLAAIKGYTEMVRTLLEFHADIKLRDKNCCTALHHAVEGNHLELATMLVKRGVDLNAEDYKYGRTALHIAAEKGYTEMVTMLLIRGADMYATGDQFYSRTPLHLACIHGHTAVVRVLVKRGADVAVLSGFLDKNPLHLACENGHWEAAEILVNKGMDLDVCGNHINGSTALHICAQLNQLAILQILVEKGANMEKLGRFSTVGTPLHVACQHGNAHAANLLINLGADRNARDETAHTPLHYACKYDKYDCAFMLVDHEVDIHARADNNKTAFDYVSVPTIKERLVIAAGIVAKRIEARLEAERRAAEAEAERLRQEQERLERLRLQEEERIRQAILRTAAFTKALRSVADISGEMSALFGVAEAYPDQDINTNIILPITEYVSDSFRYAQDNDYDMDSLTGTVHSHTTVGTTYEVYQLVNSLSDSSALTRASLRGFTDIVHAILQWPGVNINYKESNGNTALHNAALIGNREIVEMLLLAGANLTILNHDGKVAANVAKTAYLRELIRNPALMKDRMRYQDRVLDHIFLQLKCKEGMSLTLAEAQEANAIIEYTPIDPRKKAANSANSQSSAPVGNALVIATSVVDESISPPKSQSKYYKPPKRKADLIPAHNKSNSAHKSILKHAPDAVVAPLVVFTPDTVPPQLAHLFPQKALALPGYALQQGQAPGVDGPFLSNGVDMPVAPSSNVRYQGTQPAPPAAARSDPVVSNIIQKYGPVPGAFGGCVSDFFFLQSTPKRKLFAHGGRAPAADAMFLDLLTLQRGYVPSAFDSTDDWNEIKDFLWLLGYQYKPQKSQEEIYASAAYGDAHSVHSELSHYTGGGHAPVTEDRRYYLYKLAVTMNNIQSTFTDTDCLEVKTNSPKGAGGSSSTLILSSSAQEFKLPMLAAPHAGKNSGPTNFMSSPVAQIKRALSLEAQSFREAAEAEEHRLKEFESGLDWARIPSNISRQDVHRLVRFAKHCEEYVQLVLQLYAPKDLGWPNEMKTEDGWYVTENVRYNVQYMRYYGLVNEAIEEQLLNLVDLSYTAVFMDAVAAPKSSRKVAFQQEDGGEQFGAPQPESDSASRDRRKAERTRKVPDLLHNPPRYWRLAVDCVYEVSEFIKSRAEQGYPLDSVRAHLWAQAGRALISQQRGQAAQALRGPASPVAEGGAHTTSAASSSNNVLAPLPGSSAMVPSSAAVVTVPSIELLGYRRWLSDLLLADYEAYFHHQGFRRLTDFIGLTEQDCTEYFPFLKAGDLRRLTRAAPQLTDEVVAQYLEES